ncbi:type II secretion system protein M [Paracoccus sp. WLY502]|uniref:type II secretion system protein M n=1 Tax=Paracoccus yibinensis TaxID=3068891 RepID=UPI002796D3C1|nr:type II secretion system protein M [Paracoccus sp. WLY502]MDQ1901653.1 type II secretion system protein M [Paracoccus sp. WLY502]
MMAAIRQGAGRWLKESTARERWLLILGGVAVLIWLAFTYAWQPLQERREALGRQIALYERAIVALQAAPVRATAAPSDPRSLNAIVADSAREFGLSIRRLEPEGNRIRVTLEDAAFQSVILWLKAMQEDSGLRASELDMTRRPAPAVVNATLVLER